MPHALAALCLNRDELAIQARSEPGATRFETTVGELSCEAIVDGRVPGCGAGPLPLWALERVRRSEVGSRVTLLAAAELPPGVAEDIDAAVSAVVAAGLALPDARAVLEVPASAGAFAAASRGAADASTGAVTLERPGATSVVWNPTQLAVPAETRRFLLAHELTHALARTSRWERWLAEGWAEHVAAPFSPAALAEADARLTEELRAHGLPRDLPGAEAFRAGTAAEPSYAMARLAVETLVTLAGPTGAAETTRAWAEGRPGLVERTTLVEQWRAALAGRS